MGHLVKCGSWRGVQSTGIDFWSSEVRPNRSHCQVDVFYHHPVGRWPQCNLSFLSDSSLKDKMPSSLFDVVETSVKSWIFFLTSNDVGFGFLYFLKMWACGVVGFGVNIAISFTKRNFSKYPRSFPSSIPCSPSWNRRTNSGQPLLGLMTSTEISTWFVPAHPWKLTSLHFLNRRGPLLSLLSLSSSD